MSSVHRKVCVTSPLGLHARPAAAIVSLTQKFFSDVSFIDSAKTEANGRSVISLLSLGAAEGSIIDLIVEGEDCEELAEKIVDFFAEGFGEKI